MKSGHTTTLNFDHTTRYPPKCRGATGRNRAKLGRALHKLRSSFAVNPRYKFHHFFEPFLLLKLLVFAKSAHKLQRVYRDEYTTELSYDFIVVNRTIFQ